MDSVSIIIPVLDPGDTLVKVLDSLTIQSRLPEEVILKGLDQFQSISFTELLTANRDMHKILTNEYSIYL